jgi:hypothetical protein
MGHQTTELEPVIKYIKAGWDFAIGERTIKLEAPCSDMGSEALQTDDFEWIAAAWGLDVLVGWQGCDEAICFEVQEAKESRLEWLKSVLKIKDQDMTTNLIDPARDADIARELLGGEFAGAIVRQDTQDVLLVNQNLITESEKPIEVWQGKPITPLWDDEELERVLRFLNADKQLTNFEYTAYRWAKEPDSPIWKREKHRFIADLREVTFLGIPCRMTFTKQAEKMIRVA